MANQFADVTWEPYVKKDSHLLSDLGSYGYRQGISSDVLPLFLLQLRFDGAQNVEVFEFTI